MRNELYNISDNSNIEIHDNSLEMLLHATCKSYECSDFRANQCRMKEFLNVIESGDWNWSQTWMTPTKFFLHIIRHSEDATKETLEKFEELKEKWDCLSETADCECNFFEQMRQLKQALETISKK
jgi:hypothetical protein